MGCANVLLRRHTSRFALNRFHHYVVLILCAIRSRTTHSEGSASQYPTKLWASFLNSAALNTHLQLRDRKTFPREFNRYLSIVVAVPVAAVLRELQTKCFRAVANLHSRRKIQTAW